MLDNTPTPSIQSHYLLALVSVALLLLVITIFIPYCIKHRGLKIGARELILGGAIPFLLLILYPELRSILAWFAF